ncbi:sigma 54-interacting transcriptional regulator [Dyadobacter sp. CY351]|uniref:sigma-54-dependent Fis family transcriptional regulator n=1 Tax=Dyadobacter sp. CY351 TaxID=2909337 RepID=UPI001F2C3CDC|nr:sigma 54-interacting transcriptional regulator [Dyadobacter sp. CY351]MCF2518811.1 sigma 54-interacting transcriptional regulator [Dyadobacter sp. CY351]
MKKTLPADNLPVKNNHSISLSILQQQLDAYENEKNILLALSNDITRVRGKSDLIVIFSEHIKSLFYFSHVSITLIDESQQYYSPFLLDHQSIDLKNHRSYGQLANSKFPLDEPIIQKVVQAGTPVTYFLEDIIAMPGIPPFLVLNHEVGIKEVMFMLLKNKDKPIGFINIYSDRAGVFTPEFKSIIAGIAPQLSNAVSNIIVNEQVSKSEGEKSFLLNFSQDVAAVRTKDDLENAIFSVLQRVLKIRLAMIRIIEDDGVTLAPYMYDKEMFVGNEEVFKQLASKNITIQEHLSAKVLGSKEPVIFDIPQEERQGNSAQYIAFWKRFGLQHAYGAALRVGNKDIGTLWLLTDEVNLTILKGICAQISIAISNILANDKVLAYKQMLEVENDHLKEQIRTIFNYSDIIGSGPAMQQVYHLMSLVSETNSTVLLLGETGTGKELIARAVHNSSPRKNKLMIKVNCAALPANLIESELFGHEKGAFTGAVERRIGKFELANNSTLFLDEIGEMPLESQVKLLRVLQEKELERVGGKNTIKVDVRIIAATNRDLELEVRAGRFRSDLFYRLNVFPIHLPPLRERLEDIAPLATFFVGRYSKNAGRKINAISPKVFQELKSYLWPGNVRELEHLIERSVLLSSDSTLREIYLPKSRSDMKNDAVDLSKRTLEEVERAYIIEVIKRCSGKVAGAGGAAEYLDLPATTLHSKIKKLGIGKADYF